MAVLATTYKDSSDNVYINRTTNTWESVEKTLFPSGDAYINQLYTLYTGSVEYANQIWGLAEEQYYNQVWDYTAGTANYVTQIWYYETLNYIHQTYGDRPEIIQYINQYYWDGPSTVTYKHQTYGDMGVAMRSIHQIFDLIGEVKKYYNQDYSISGESTAQNFINQLWNLEGVDFAEKAIHQIWSIVETPTSTGNITYGVTINGMSVFSPDINIEIDEDRATIEGNVSIVNPAYFHLCTNNNPINITINSTVYNLLIRDVGVNMTLPSDVYSLKCQSPVVMLSSNQAPVLQKEYDAGLASVIATELVESMNDTGLVNLSLTWNVVHQGAPIDWEIPAGELFANKEKPMAVLRKITEACGATIQSLPDGTVEITHEFPDAVPDWPTTTPQYIVNNLVKFESVSASDEEKSGINTIFVSDQLTSDTSYTLEEEEISPTRKRVKGFHTPWDSTEVELTTAGGSSVVITYLGVVEENMPIPTDTDPNPSELVEFINGTGSVSKPIYGDLISHEWVLDSLGAVTPAEDGTLESELKDESLLRVRYITRFHLWEVSSPVIADVQCHLRLVS